MFDACGDGERLVVNGGRKAETFEGCGCVRPSRNWPMVRLATWKSSSSWCYCTPSMVPFSATDWRR